MTEYKTYETERLLLKPTYEEDAAFVFELFNTPDWLRYIGNRNVLSIENAREYIKCKMLPQLERLGFGNYTVIRKSDHVSMGICGLYDREGLDGLDNGFAFLPEYGRNGYAFEAANKLKQVAFTKFGITEIVAITTQDNIASQKLLEKLGLTLTGTTKIPNDDEELLLYKISN
jgi:RimJ/RimL family protein N-acetyltransferase